jgi:uridylate kinase
MKIVVKVGGSLCIGEDGPDYSYLSKLLPVLEKLDEESELSVGIGGGKLVRRYGEAISNFDLTDRQREECFIEITKANARFLGFLLRKKPLFSLEGYGGDEVVVAGIEPGRSTDANSAAVAREMDADLFIILTDVDGIYDKDPDEHEDADKLEKLSFEQVNNFEKDTSPLNYGVVDPLALDIIGKNKIKTAVIDGKNPEKILDVIEGQNPGTIISD